MLERLPLFYFPLVKVFQMYVFIKFSRNIYVVWKFQTKTSTFNWDYVLSIRRLCYDLMEYDTLHSIGCTLHNYGVRGLQVITSFNHVQTLCNPKGCSQPGSFVYGILQARIMEWVAISFLTQGLNQGVLNWRQILYPLSHWGSLSIITVHVNIIS